MIQNETETEILELENVSFNIAKYQWRFKPIFHHFHSLRMKVNESEWKWMKVHESAWKCMKVNKSEQKWMKVNKSERK